MGLKSCAKRVFNEITYLRQLQGEHNVVELQRVLQGEGKQISLVLNYFAHVHFKHYFGEMDAEDARHYMRELFIALRHLHRHKVGVYTVNENSKKHITKKSYIEKK